MNIKLLGVLLSGSLLMACGSSDNKSSSSSASSISSDSSISISSSEASYSSEVSSSSTTESSISSSDGAVSSSPSVVAWRCPATGLYFCDDLATGTADKWDLKPTTSNTAQPDGEWDLVDDNGNYIMRYTAASSGGVLALVKPSAFSDVTSGDYYVEAKIRPRANSTTGNKQLYLLARYIDGNNWYAGALNVQNATTSTQVEIAKMIGGTLSRPKQIKKPINQGLADMLDGQWYSLRLELLGNTLTVYLDGENLGVITDESFSEQGLIGFWTANKSFEVDDIKVGNANDKPASLIVSPSATSYAAEVGDPARVITVTAKSDTGENDSFTVVSSDNNIVSVSVIGEIITLTPVGEGEATITITSGAELSREISALVAPQFVMPTANYNLTGLTIPEVGEDNVYEDTTLKLTFDSAPSLGSTGSIRIFKASDDSLVDTIKLIDEVDTIGYGSVRKLNTKPVRITNNTVSISLHANKLSIDTAYYVAVSASAFTGAKLAGQTFEGIGKNTGWLFTTRAATPDAGLTTITVDDNGSVADFRSVQSALNYAMQHVALNNAVTINVKNGVYEEPLYLRGKNNLTIQGESRDNTIIQYSNNERLNSGSAGRALFLVESADLLTLDNLTIKNTTLIGEGGQAETIYFNSPDGRLVATNSNFMSEQDTLLLKGWTWFYHSLVAGNVDFIWGYSKASLFEKSEIRTLGRSTSNNNGGYVLQARVESAADKGFVFLNSSLTKGAGPTGELPIDGTSYLARSSGSASAFDNIVFVNTKMDTHIAPTGWAGKDINGQPAANPATANATVGWREYGSMDLMGTTLDDSGRQFGYQLNLGEVAAYCSRAQIFSDYNAGAGWNPMPLDTSDCIDIDGSSSNSSASSSLVSSVSSVVSSSSTSSSVSVSSSSSSSVSSSIPSSSSSSMSSSSSSIAQVDVLTMNFQALGGTGLAENTETTLAAAVPAPVVTNTAAYTVQLLGKLKMNTTQGPPSGAVASNGVLQFGNNASDAGKLIIGQVSCPFTLTINHAPSSTNDETRKLRITVDGAEVYYDGNGLFQTATVTPSCSGKVDVEAYGWNTAEGKGKGVRIFDVTITQ